MLRSATLFICLLMFTSPVNAQKQQFPYQARVTAPEVYVRSGAGEAFYPTKNLVRDATVTVRRHDPGGWYMIDPPEGSFSWIPAKYVRRGTSDSGEVTEGNVVVSVGSSFGDETHVWQRKLMAGEKVTIVSERVVETYSGPKQMLKIAPPKREYRWIPGSAVLPIGAAAQAKRDQDPYQVPSSVVKQREREQTQIATAAPADTPQPPPSRFSQSKRLATLTKIRDEQMQLHELDQRFRNMILADPSQWKLEEMEQAYLELQNNATHKPVAGQIDLRYPAIRRYRQRKAEFDDLNRLTSETERRDAELIAGQFGLSPPELIPGEELSLALGQTIGDEFANTTPATAPVTMPLAPNGTMLIPNIDTAFMTSTPGDAVAVVPPTGDPTKTYPEGASTKVYVGAGYVQRATESEGNGFLLLSNAGKVLAHLKSDGTVNLEDHIGRAVGVKGNRYFDKSTKVDRIDVTGLENVTIR